MILAGLGSKVAMTAVMLWLVVGIYGNILKSGHIVEGLVWLSVKLGVSGSVFTVAAFVFAALFAMATGSGFGTISTMSFILYPAGILLGANPAVLAGAILSGAAMGDNFAPVSDTTIIASTSQEYSHKEGSADIGGTVRARFRYVIVAAVIAIILFLIFGGTGSAINPEEAAVLLAQYQRPFGLLLLIPTLIVILMAIRGINIFACLGSGIVLASVIGLVAGLFDFSALISIREGSIRGAIPNGVAGMFNVSILLMVVVSMGNLMIASGCMERVVNWLNESVIKSERGAELSLFCRATMLSYLICTYIKEYSGRLSAFCGCAIAAGSGMACAIVYLKGGGVKEMEYTLNNMASSITGMICDGGNQGCTMKGVAACDAAFRSVEFAMNGVHIDKVHGINGATPEDTMRNMGLIASPGMVGTEKTIVEIFEGKLK